MRIFRTSPILCAAAALSIADLTGADGPPKPVEGPDIMKLGRIGGIKIGTSEKVVRAAIKFEFEKGEDIVWEAIGEAVQEWTSPEAGLSLMMASDEIGGEKSVLSITVTGGSALRTGRGVGIGTTREEVLKAYSGFKTEPDDGFFGEEDIHLVGSIYGGMIFTFKDGKVTEIFLGAAAE